MHVIARSTLQSFWESSQHADSEGPLKAWYAEAKKAQWKNPAEIKQQYRSASVLKSGRVVFNIAGNKYRLVVVVRYATATVYVRFIGTHDEYDKIDIGKV